MSATLFFKRFLQRPKQVAYIVPSSPMLINRVMKKMDFSKPRTIVEFGPGEGCHTREIIKRMHPDSKLLLFEIDAEFTELLRKQFRHDPRIHILHTDAARLPQELARLGIEHCDYVVSGIPFSYIDKEKKEEILQNIHSSLAPQPHSAFIVYQVTNELINHAKQFTRVESKYCLQNIPPMVVIKFHKMPLNGHSASTRVVNGNGHHHH